MYLVLGIPIILFTAIFQTTIISRLLFENGTANLLIIIIIIWGMHDRAKGSWVLAIISGLLFTFLSSVPFGVYIFTFLVVNLIVQMIRNKIWNIPFLILIMLIIIGTFIEHFSTYIGLSLAGYETPIGTILTSVMIPSIILNLIWAFPIFIVLNRLLNWMFPEPEEK